MVSYIYITCIIPLVNILRMGSRVVLYAECPMEFGRVRGRWTTPRTQNHTPTPDLQNHTLSVRYIYIYIYIYQCLDFSLVSSSSSEFHSPSRPATVPGLNGRASSKSKSSIPVCLCVCVCVCVCMYILYMHSFTHSCIHARMHK